MAMTDGELRRFETLRKGIAEAPTEWVNIYTADAQWLIDIASPVAVAESPESKPENPPIRLET